MAKQKEQEKLTLMETMKLPEPDRTKALNKLSEASTYPVYNPNPAFMVTYQGEPQAVKDGKSEYPLHFAIFLLHKFGGFSDYGDTSRTLDKDFEYLLESEPEEELTGSVTVLVKDAVVAIKEMTAEEAIEYVGDDNRPGVVVALEAKVAEEPGTKVGE